MNKKGYRVIWTSNRDTILYECPNGKRCRDFKLHEDKYLKGAMENEFAKRKEFLRRYEGHDEAGTNASDLRSDNRGKLGKSYQSAGTPNIDNATATRHTSDNDYNRTDGRIDKQSDREYANLPREAGFNNRETQQSYESDRVGFQQVSHKTDQRTEGRNQENDEGNILTGWENERRFFEQSFYGERTHERYAAQAKDNQLGTDSNASLITWSINFMGNFADLLSTNKEVLPASETITIFTPEEIEKFKKECFKTWGTGKPFYQQSAAYILMLNTGLRTAELLGLHNDDIDLENKVMRIQRGVKEVGKRVGTEKQPGREITVGKLKTASSRRVVPLNSTAIEMIKKLREEFYFGEDSPLVCDENGNYTKPSNFRKRFYRILDGAKIEKKGLHSLRHTFATNLVNGIKQPDGTIKSLTPRQVADLLGHSTSDITEMYYVKRNDDLLNGITNGFEI